MNKCLECSKETSNPKFCSLSCGSKMQARSRVIKDKSKKCVGCGNLFEYSKDPNQKFCSHSCSAKVSNKNRAKENPYCVYCKTMQVKTRVAKFCSTKCSGAYQTQWVVDAWILDPSTATTTQGVKSAIKKHLISQANYSCSKCSWAEINQVTKRCPLEVDHIDGDAYNNAPANLQVLCPNCHSLTDTYRALNKNSKRRYRNSKK